MGKTLILAIDELAPNQVQAFSTVNDALAAMEAAENSTLAVDTSDSNNYEIAELDFVRYYNLALSGHAEDFDLILPSLVNTNNTDRTIGIQNYEDYIVTITTDDPGEVVLLPPLSTVIVRVVAGDVYEVARGGLAPDGNNSLSLSASGGNVTLTDDQYRYYHIYYITSHSVARTLIVPLTHSRIITVTNSGTGDLTVQSTTPGTTVIIPIGQTRRLHVNYANVVELNSDPQRTIFNLHQIAAPANGAEVGGRYTFVQTTAIIANWLTFGVGTITFTAQPDDTDTITIDDGVKSIIFEFDSGGGVTGSNVAVTIGASFDATGTALALAINAANINVVAWYDTGTNICTVRNLNGAGGSISETSGSPDFSVVTFAGGVNGARGNIVTNATLNTFLVINKVVGATSTEVGTLRIDPLGGFCFRSGTRESGNILFNAQPDDGDTLTLTDGFVTIIYEFDSNATVTAGNISVTIGGDFNATAATLVGLIMAGPLNIEAVYTTPNLALKNGNCTGGSITKVDADNDYTVTNFSGGVAASNLSFSPGHCLSVINQATADATAARIAATFMGR